MSRHVIVPMILAGVLLAFPPATVRAEGTEIVPSSTEEIALSFAPVVRAAAPAVVNIYARRVIADRRNPFAGDPFFGDLFRGFGPAIPRVQNALGSGVILTDDGIVVSNYHVVGNATDIRVVLSDRREYAAEVILTDEESDLAILKLDGAEALPALALADSDQVEVGELVLAIGNPFGVGQTVSSGIISGLARSGIAIGSGRGYFIQTDAAINPGNSGGALVDMRGRIVGINTAILTRSGGSLGIGFAIPANLVAQVVAQALEGNTSFVRPWAGMTGQGMDSSLAEALGMGLPEGVVITDIHPNSPFGAAGLRAGDVVLSVDDGMVNSAPEMMFRLAAAGIGADARISFLRDGVVLDVRVALVAPPEIPERDPRTIAGNTALRGLSVETINPAVIAEHGLPLDAEGVVIAGVRDTAARTGLRPGDILRAINGIRVSNSVDVVNAAMQGGRSWQIDVLREGRPLALRFRM